MPTVTSQEIISQVNHLLNDTGYIRWPKPELLGFLNDAIKAIVMRRPDAHTKDVDDFTCAAGTKQVLPSDALRLIDVPRNESGRAIRGPFDRNVLDNNYPDWFGGNDAAFAELYLYDERNPKTFYLYPGVSANTKINIVYSTVPTVITEADNLADAVIALDDIYENAITEWMLYRCYSKDADFAANPNKAAMHLNAFKSQLGEKSQADAAMTSPKISE